MDTNVPPNNEVDPKSLAQGHETDRIDARSILYVPAVLLVCFVLAYGTVTLMIDYLRAPSTEKPANALTAQNNDVPLNERLHRIDSSNPNAEVKQPRLEALEEMKGLDKKKEDGGTPPYLRSLEPKEGGSSPHFHPEQLRASSQYSKELGLQDYGWGKEKDVVRIPIEEAMKAVLKAKNPKDAAKSYLPIQQKNGHPVQIEQLQSNAPKASNPQWSGARKEGIHQHLEDAP